MARVPHGPCVLVYGASLDGWCWRAVADRRRGRGHAVTTPTLTGLGERAHFLNGNIDLHTHIADIENHIRFEDLDDIVLVGHSYSGAVITGVADRVPDRIGRLIYLDAMLVYDRETIMSEVPKRWRRTGYGLRERPAGWLCLLRLRLPSA